METNATAIDSIIYRDVFSTSAMREVWSDETRIQRYLDAEKALSLTQGRLEIIPQAAADEIASHCEVAQIDFTEMTAAMEHIGHLVLPVVQPRFAQVRCHDASPLVSQVQGSGQFNLGSAEVLKSDDECC